MARERVSEIVAEMVANVMSVAVEPGDKVAAGDVVILLESMKMEIPVIAEDRRHRAGGQDRARPTSSRRATCCVELVLDGLHAPGRGGGIRTRG